MLGRCLQLHYSKQQRAMYFVFVCFVFSYIAFDVLDLDGSNLPSFAPTIERSAIVAVIPSEVEISYSSDAVDHLHTISALLADPLREYLRLRMTSASESSLLLLARAHGYHIGLARDSLPD
jgi:hypothetical protein